MKKPGAAFWWTNEEKRIATEGHAAGLSLEQISAILPGRTISAVSHFLRPDKEEVKKRARERTKKPGMDFKSVARICLKCRETFWSTNFGNRVCRQCLRSEAFR